MRKRKTIITNNVYKNIITGAIKLKLTLFNLLLKIKNYILD